MKKCVWPTLLLISLIISGCAVTSPNINDIQIALIGGIASENISMSFVRGAQTAVEKFNSGQNTFSLEMELVDDGSTYKEGVSAAESLSLNRKISAVINMQDYTIAETAVDIISNSGKVSILPMGAFGRVFEKGYKNVFMPYPDYTSIGAAMGKYAIESGHKRMAVYCAGWESEREEVIAMQRELIDSDCEIVDYIEGYPSRKDFSDIYSRWSALGVECAVVVCYNESDAFDFVNALDEKKSDISVISDTIFTSSDFDGYYPNHINISYTDFMDIDYGGENYLSFERAYKDLFGELPDTDAVYGYNAANLIITAIQESGSGDAEQIAAALNSGGKWSAIGFDITFAENGSLSSGYENIVMLKK